MIKLERMNKPMRIGLFGGTFDPIHFGHLMIAETVRSDFPLDRMLFIPAATSPHKVGESLSSAEIRFKMVQRAIDSYSGLGVSDVEIQKRKISYTVDTVKWFRERKEWLHDEFYLLIGSDSFLELNTWKDPEEILEQVRMLVVSRPGFDIEEGEERFREKMTVVKAPLIDISSSEIRKRVRLGKSIRYWVPESVEGIIFEKGLYR